MRDEIDHDPFGTSAIQLVLGRSEAGDIVHVARVARGRACRCSCPACGEALIARQGEVKTWHFAHESGASCIAAQNEALVARLLQLLEKGSPLHLPAAPIAWGASEVSWIPKRILAFTSLGREADVISATTDGGEVFEIITATDQRRKPPASGHHVYRLAFDFRAAHAEACDEAALDRYLLEKAPRRWLYHPRIEKTRGEMISARLGPWLAAHGGAGGKALDLPSHASCITRLQSLHLEAFISGPAIEGEMHLAAPARSWRAAIFHDLVVAPFLAGPDLVMVRDAGFGQAGIERVIAAHHLDPLADPDFSLSSNDRIEAQRLMPGRRAPLNIIDDYLIQLVHRRALRRSPLGQEGLSSMPRGGTDPRLTAFPHLAWIADERIATHVRRMRRAEVILSGF